MLSRVDYENRFVTSLVRSDLCDRSLQAMRRTHVNNTALSYIYLNAYFAYVILT